jgi:type I restriction enzyme R subunit
MMQISTPDLMANNLAFHRLLTEGINIEVSKDGNTQGELACLIDFNDPTNNEFLVINQLTIKEGNHTRRPDLILFINGLPLVVIELKNAADENATVTGAITRLKPIRTKSPACLPTMLLM